MLLFPGQLGQSRLFVLQELIWKASLQSPGLVVIGLGGSRAEIRLKTVSRAFSSGRDRVTVSRTF